MKVQICFVFYYFLSDQTFGPYGVWPDIENILPQFRSRWCTKEDPQIRNIDIRLFKNPYSPDKGKIIKGLRVGYNDATNNSFGMNSKVVEGEIDKQVKIERGTHISSVILSSGWFLEQLGFRTTHNSIVGQLDNSRDGYIQIPPKYSDNFGASLKTICGETTKVGDDDIIGNLYFTFKIESEPGKCYKIFLSNTTA